MYTISGTASAAGTANFALNIAGQSCTLSLNVNPGALPAGITLDQITPYFIASVYDKDYLPYSAPFDPATWDTNQAADGADDSKVIDLQGQITVSGIAIYIPYMVTASSAVNLPAYNQIITVPGAYTQDGISRQLRLSYNAATYSPGSGIINATVRSVGGTLNIKKLDLQTGLGPDNMGVLLGRFLYATDQNGSVTNFDVRVIPGIPDKRFGEPDNAGDVTTHQFLYMPVYTPMNKVWLNNNLGANYNNINSAVFNPNKQASSSNDTNAYGSYFQWGRRSDGHELMTYTSITTTRSDNPTNTSFIKGSGSLYDWRINTDNTLWQTTGAVNNPCPAGYRLPTGSELDKYVSSQGINDANSAYNSPLKIALPGYIDLFSSPSKSILSAGTYGGYWSGTSGSGFYPEGKSIGASYVYNNTWHTRSYGLSVRCIKD